MVNKNTATVFESETEAKTCLLPCFGAIMPLSGEEEEDDEK